MLGKPRLHHDRRGGLRHPNRVQQFKPLNCYVLETVLTDPDSPQSGCDMDQLFLLPDRVLGMDSLSFREDVAAVAPDFLTSVHLKNSPPHNSLDSTDSNRHGSCPAYNLKKVSCLLTFF